MSSDIATVREREKEEAEKVVQLRPEGVPVSREAPRVATQIYLQPVAAPMILGLFSLASATFVVGSFLAHWYAPSASVMLLVPFVAIFGGLTQLLAGMWAYRARDSLATAIHGMWGSFWLAYGVLYGLFSSQIAGITGTAFPELGIAFIAIAAISWVLTFASLSRNITLFATMGLLSIGTTLGAIAYLAGSATVLTVSGWFMLIGGIIGWYTGGAMVLNTAFGRRILPVGKLHMSKVEPEIANAYGEPGVTRLE